MTRKKSSEEMGAPADDKSHEDFLALFRRGLKFSEELLAENGKLRFRVASLENELEVLRKHGTPEGELVIRDLRSKIAQLEQERTHLVSSYREVETLNRDYQARYAEIEEEHNNLANLYIASYQLHSTMTFRDVVQVISEIVINLIGASHFAMYLLDTPTEVLHAIAAEGRDIDSLSPIPLSQAPIGVAVKNRQRAVESHRPAGEVPLAIVPLATLETTVGAIVIDKLLVQKQGFSPVDNELFNLLSVHAATALLSGLLRDHVGDGGGRQALSIAHARRLLQF